LSFKAFDTVETDIFNAWAKLLSVVFAMGILSKVNYLITGIICFVVGKCRCWDMMIYIEGVYRIGISGSSFIDYGNIMYMFFFIYSQFHFGITCFCVSRR